MLKILENVSLKSFNSFGIDVLAKFFVEITEAEQLTQLFAEAQFLEIPRIIIGGGSNMLFTQDFEGLVIRMNIKGIAHEINHHDVFVTAGAGEVWNDLVNYCVDAGFGGIENLSLIPGSVGASPIQNIGAYGVELKDVFESCQSFEIASQQIKTFSKADCQFDYRESIFKQALKNQYIITEVKFKLTKQADINISYGAIADELTKRGIQQPKIKDVSEVVSAIRVAKLPDPSTIGNAGSFFKNPIISKPEFDKIYAQFPNVVHFVVGDQMKLAAGWLIEQCGWKGKMVGNTGTWKNQALVLVNHGGATGDEIYKFSEDIISSVHQKFGVRLQREVNVF